MCGIVGYIGHREVSHLLIDGLKRLEYRGYDSWGVAMIFNGSHRVIRNSGRIAAGENAALQSIDYAGTQYGIGHTRWATHGRPTENNAHPHVDCTAQFMVAHNGIIDNYRELRNRLSSEGHRFQSDTDTEVLPHLIESNFRGSLEDAVLQSLREIEGAYGVVAVSTRDKEKIVAARKGPPLVIGLGEDENFVASDIPAVLPYTRQMMLLDDGEIAVIRRKSVSIRDRDGNCVERTPMHIDWSPELAERNGYPHFMLKEIFEQPRAVTDTIRGRLDCEGRITMEDSFSTIPARLDRITVVACGTSLHAAMAGKVMIEQLAGIPVDIDHASEFRYRNPLLSPRGMTIAISQSGETADTLGAALEAKSRGEYLLAICNVVGSQITRQADSVLYTHAGPEIGVASTKAFTTQLVAFYLLALFLAERNKRMSREQLKQAAVELLAIPDQIESILRRDHAIVALADQVCRYQNFLYLGRGLGYPLALEGALKLKEISYIHAEGYPAGEMKHGPIALIDPDTPVVALAPQDHVRTKMIANIEEVKGRGAHVISVATEGDTDISKLSDYTMFIPPSSYLLSPLLTVIPLQMLAYHIGVNRGCDVDKPRNLAKSVTVE
jgi:glucosamine--fructose-6-phosphate aminotransferase (isomerizing)